MQVLHTVFISARPLSGQSSGDLRLVVQRAETSNPIFILIIYWSTIAVLTCRQSMNVQQCLTLPGRRCNSQIGSLIPTHSNYGRHLRKAPRHTVVLGIGLASETHMLSVVLSGHSFHHPCRTGHVGTECWRCAVPSGEDRNEDRHCLTKLRWWALLDHSRD
jgi:hypothetical protein